MGEIAIEHLQIYQQRAGLHCFVLCLSKGFILSLSKGFVLRRLGEPMATEKGMVERPLLRTNREITEHFRSWCTPTPME